MEHLYSIRLDMETDRMLQMLADRTFRSRAGVIRMLIHRSSKDPNLVPHEIKDFSEQPLTSGSEFVKRENQEVQG